MTATPPMNLMNLMTLSEAFALVRQRTYMHGLVA